MACVTVFPSNTVISMKLPNSASIFTAEIWANSIALEEILNYVASKYIVFTDALSCLQALKYMKLKHPLIGMEIRKCVFCQDTQFCVGYPAILGLRERVDSAAKSALELPRAKVGVPYNNFKHRISEYILSTGQNDWNDAVVNKLHSVKPVLGNWQSSFRR